MASGTRLAIGGMVIACAIAYLGYSGATSSWQYYLTVDECLSEASSLPGIRLRVSGTIAGKSLFIDSLRTQATFSLKGTTQNLPVTYSGSLPDNLAEEMEVVVEGRLVQAEGLLADRVLTRCASKYAAPVSTAAGDFAAPRATGRSQ